jgi:hypothetical protein
VSNATAIRLPRRLRRPPARLVFLGIDYALCVALVTFWLVVAIIVGEWRLAGSALVVVWMTFAASASRDFARTFAAWRRGEPCRPVSRIEWCVLTWQLLGVLVIVLGLVPV